MSSWFFTKEDELLGDVSGNMNIPSINKPTNGDGVPEFNTLDEPIRMTIVNIANFPKLSVPLSEFRNDLHA